MEKSMRFTRIAVGLVAGMTVAGLAACGTSPASGGSGSSGSAVPAAGPGSFQGVATDPVATAASNNPVLSTLVTAVKQAGLVDTLNGANVVCGDVRTANATVCIIDSVLMPTGRPPGV
jgi:hypothetical protein